MQRSEPSATMALNLDAPPEPSTSSTAVLGRPDLRLDGRYVLRDSIGRGGTAEVWRAHDLRLGRTVAIKLFHAAHSHDPRVRSEATVLASLSHPNLVTVFDAVLEGVDGRESPSYLVTEYVPGHDLRRRLEQTQTPLTTQETAGLLSQLADALNYIHGRGIVHRDIKPANIMLESEAADARPTAKLTDFGIALLRDAGPRLTEHGSTIGTSNYMSPEQVTGSPIGPPSDVYSLGLVLAECLSGEPVYPGHGVEAALARLHHPAAFSADDLDPQWRELLTAMTDSVPGNRPTAQALAETADRLPSGAAQTYTLPLPTTVDARSPHQPGSTIAVLLHGGDAHRSDGAATEVLSRGRRAFGLVELLACAVLLMIVVVFVVVASATTSPRPSPTYPTVNGKLGQDLSTLQHDVQP